MNYTIRKARGGQGCRLGAKLVAGLRKRSQTPAVGGLVFLCLVLLHYLELCYRVNCLVFKTVRYCLKKGSFVVVSASVVLHGADLHHSVEGFPVICLIHTFSYFPFSTDSFGLSLVL